MSLGLCRCPCERWPHYDVCDGTARHSLPRSPHLEGWAHQPCCPGCYRAIQEATDRRAITPRES